MTNVVLIVEGMTCGHCARTVEGSVRSLPGVQTARVDLAKKELTAAFDASLVDVEGIELAIGRAGYAVAGRGAQ